MRRQLRPGFSMYGSCGVRYFHVDDDFMYGTESEVYDGATRTMSPTMVEQQTSKSRTASLARKSAGPATTAGASGTCSATARSASSTTTRAFGNGCTDEAGNWATFQDGSNMNVRSSKDSVAFLGELRVGTAYDITCHWRGVIAYRAVAITGLATAADRCRTTTPTGIPSA